MRTKVILDVDTGIDDALAIAFLLGKKEVDVIGITTCFGNVTVETATENTLNLLHLLGRDDVRVYPGARGPWNGREWIIGEHLHRIHGYNGIGNVELEKSPNEAEKTTAWQFMVESARRYGSELMLICVGPLTNLANAIKLDKEAIASCQRITLMDGALTVSGNISPYAEANVYNDSDAAEYVLSSGIDVNMIGLDVTLQTIVTDKELGFWQTLNTVKSRKLFDIAAYYYFNEFKEVKGGALHDPLAVEAAVNPDIADDWLKINLTVDQEGVTRGRIHTTKELMSREHKNVNYALNVDADTFIRRFADTVSEVLK